MGLVVETVLPVEVALIKAIRELLVLELDNQPEALGDPYGFTLKAIVAWSWLNLLHKPALASGHRSS